MDFMKTEFGIVSGPKEVLEIFTKANEYNKKVSDSSEFPIGTIVKISDNVQELTRELAKGGVLNDTDAYMTAKTLAGEKGIVIAVNELTDDGKLGIYYTVEVDVNGLELAYVFSRKMIKR